MSRDGRSASTLPDFPTAIQRDMTVADHGSLALTNSSVSLSTLHWAVVSQRQPCPLTRHTRRAPAAVSPLTPLLLERELLQDLRVSWIGLFTCMFTFLHSSFSFSSSCLYWHICCIYPPFFFLTGRNLCHVTHVLLHKREQNRDPHSTTTGQKAPQHTFK